MAKIKKIGKSKIKRSQEQNIIVDADRKLIFETQEELYKYFKNQIKILEQEYQSVEPEGFYPLENAETYFESTLDEPDEIWLDKETLEEDLYHFIKAFEVDDKVIYYVACCYVDSEDSPSFVFLHFATDNPDVVDNYRRSEIIFEKSLKEVLLAGIEGDALSEADPLSVGLFAAMLKVRGEKDIPVDQFYKYADLREKTIEEPDEIWRQHDSNGPMLVTFIKEFSEGDAVDLHYIAITQEDQSSQVHALLFSFPTTDLSLVDRYRHGENLQADEVVQESSH